MDYEDCVASNFQGEIYCLPGNFIFKLLLFFINSNIENRTNEEYLIIFARINHKNKCDKNIYRLSPVWKYPGEIRFTPVIFCLQEKLTKYSSMVWHCCSYFLTTSSYLFFYRYVHFSLYYFVNRYK